MITMKAVQFTRYGGPDVLEIADIEEPHAGPGQVRVAVHAAAVNPVDWKVRSGAFGGGANPPEKPVIVGFDVSGVVDEVGAGVDGVALGDRVFGRAVGGATAEFTVVSHFAVMPAGMSFEEAAGLTMVSETALRGLRKLGLSAGQTILINGAAGGVGLAAAQFAQAMGALVIGTASEPRHEFLRSLGVIPTTYGPGLTDRVREIAPSGVDLAFDTAGRGVLPDLVELTGDADHVLTIADPTAAEHGVLFTGGAGEARYFEALELAAQLFAEGRFTMPVTRTYALDQVAEAHADSEDGHALGKRVIMVRGPGSVGK
jgi:NADPH:quinone reductase-like Zn-dependent oxidoreductase